MSLNRRSIVGAIAVSLALVLAGCSSDDSDGSSDATGAASGASDSGEMRTVTDYEDNEVEIVDTPETVVPLHFAGVQALLDLGLTPAAMPSNWERGLLTDEQYEKVKDLPEIGGGGGVDVEQIAQLDPDLILVPNMIEADVVDQLREVAPSYIYMHGGEDRGDWDGRVGQIADALNRTDEAEEKARELEERQAELAEKHADIVSDIRVSMFGAWDAGEFSANGSGSMIGKIITPVGVQFADGVEDATRDADGYEQTLSTERIGSTFGDSDVIFYSVLLDGSVDEDTDGIMEMDAFKALDAARDDHVFGLGKSTIAGYTDANYALDSLDEVLTQLAGED